MSDFLSRLVDRTLNRAPVLERRRPSVFEAPADLPGPNLSAIASETHARGDDPAEIQPKAEGAAASSPPAWPETTKSESRDAPIATPQLADHRSPPTKPTVETERSPIRAASAQPNRVREEARPERIRELETIRVIEKVTEREVIERQSVIAVQPTGVEEKSVREIAIVIQPAQEPRPLVARAKEAPPEREPPAVFKPKASLPPTILPAPRRAVRQTLAGSVSPSPTTVQVTIGRLEIRATTPPAAPRRPPRAVEPKLTLEAYLHSRR